MTMQIISVLKWLILKPCLRTSESSPVTPDILVVTRHAEDSDESKGEKCHYRKNYLILLLTME